jgi:hypothetical protein
MRNASIVTSRQISATSTVTATFLRLGGREEICLFRRDEFPGIEQLNPADQQRELKGWTVRWDEGELTDDEILEEADELISNYLHENGLL